MKATRASVALLANEFDTHQTYLLLRIVGPQFVDGRIERIALGVLLEIEVNVLDLVLVHKVPQIVRDVELRTRVDDAFDLGQQFVEIEVFGAGDILEIHLPVDGLDDEDLVARLVADRLDDQANRLLSIAI